MIAGDWISDRTAVEKVVREATRTDTGTDQLGCKLR